MTGIIMMATYEFYRMLAQKGIKTYKNFALGISFLIPTSYFFKDKIEFIMENGPYLLLTLLVIGFITVQILWGTIEKATEKISYTLFGILYIPFLFSHVFALKNLKMGNYWILSAFLLVWTCDSMAYFIGIKFGKHKMSPKISPKKSIEGGIAGIISPILSMFIIKYFLYFKEIKISFIHIILIGLIVGVFGQIGDLAESMFKREYGIKDSGSSLFGHGGFLDRFDSLIFIIPIMYYYVRFFI